ncbi:PREDICTED: uncharacterized protein LOC109593654 [Amphimedon queenslandica]|uniref:Uncharacterized protein n=2 Tax=Amphimedon queenslandica TaxID=400682 RepID=A0AAN0K4F1_AMPQE|nr:PREDICTED: uncharacterized protein LOC109593654 [Amphimedon queenslandica]|eukprot:XP_019864197.1 PREDICTED: uncharacterized protein LOC109593654 [Amphimedon queenslandica]
MVVKIIAEVLSIPEPAARFLFGLLLTYPLAFIYRPLIIPYLKEHSEYYLCCWWVCFATVCFRLVCFFAFYVGCHSRLLCFLLFGKGRVSLLLTWIITMVCCHSTKARIHCILPLVGFSCWYEY